MPSLSWPDGQHGICGGIHGSNKPFDKLGYCRSDRRQIEICVGWISFAIHVALVLIPASFVILFVLSDIIDLSSALTKTHSNQQPEIGE